MTTIEAVKHQLDALIVDLENQRREYAKRERELVAAAEQLSESERVRQAEAMGREEERGRIVALIDLQLETLQRGGLNAVSLRTLRANVLAEVQ